MEPTIQEQKRAILEKGLKAVLEESSIPRRMHLQMVQALKNDLDTYRSALSENQAAHVQSKEEIAQHASTIQSILGMVQDLSDRVEEEIQRLADIELLQGEPGKDADPIDVSQIIESLLPYIPEPIPGLPGLPGKDAEFDIEELASILVTKIKSEKLLEVTDIRNAESFLFNNKRYKFEELMRGAGGSGTGGSNTPLVPTGIVNAVNMIFGTTGQPSSVVADGITYYEGHGYSYAADTITLDVPPSQYIRYYL